MSTYPRDVEVLHDGRWIRGQLLWAYRTPEGQWRGIVHYFDREAVLGYYGPRPEHELRRPADESLPAVSCPPPPIPGEEAEGATIFGQQNS